MCSDQLRAEVDVTPFQSSFCPLCSELWPMGGHLGGAGEGAPLVGLEGTVGSSHIFRFLLVPHPHFPEDAGDAAGSTSCQW